MNISELRLAMNYLCDLRDMGILDKQQCLSFMHRAVSVYGRESTEVNSEHSEPVFPDV